MKTAFDLLIISSMEQSIGIILLIICVLFLAFLLKPKRNKRYLKPLNSHNDAEVGVIIYKLVDSGVIKEIFSSFGKPLKKLSFTEEKFGDMTSKVWKIIDKKERFMALRMEGNRCVPMLSSFTESVGLDMKNSIDTGFCEYIVVLY